jgi:RNA polymerase sigma-70 factor (ECF subfamily)
MSQQLVRAKALIKLTGIPFRLPERLELPERLAAVLDAVYAAFAAGWTDPAGIDPQRRNLAREAIWLGRLAVSLLPDEPEALGLPAPILYAEFRRFARRGVNGDHVPLEEQAVQAWDLDLTQQVEDFLLLLRVGGPAKRIGRQLCICMTFWLS